MSKTSPKRSGEVEVDVRGYVFWLLELPLRKRIKPPLKQGRCLKVARSLLRVAQHCKDRDISQLATRIWTLPLERLSGEKATLKDCREFLESYEPYLGGKHCTKAREYIDNLTDEQLTSPGEQKQRREWVEYRGDSMISYFARGHKQKWPADDLSERVFDANSALREAGCPNPAKYLAQVLKDKGYAYHYSEQHIYSRLAFFRDSKPPAWPESVWRQEYWRTLHPRSLDKSIPERQPFVFRWNG